MGAPGTSPSSAKIMPVARIALGWALNCPSTSLFRLPSDTERVTIIPVAVEIIRAGSWDSLLQISSGICEIFFWCRVQMIQRG